jgi:geranylgeranyl diphosphate synthase type I
VTSTISGPVTTETGSRAGPRPAPAVLERSRDIVLPHLEEAVASLGDELRTPVEYHLGWRHPDGSPARRGGGKFVRPALALLSAEAAGAPARVGVPGAVAVELLHNFSLIHDDVIDGDVERRHRPTVWAVFGVGTAVIAGDALLALANQILLDLPGAGGRAAARSLTCTTTALIGGQAEDAVLYDALTDFGVHLGLAFQAVDDLLGIWGDPALTGKPASSDLRDRKKTLPIALALSSGHPRAEELAACLAGAELGEDDLVRAADLVAACGGRDGTEEEAARFTASALAALEGIGLPDATHHDLTELAGFLLDRDF